jgi:hypothetical protein
MKLSKLVFVLVFATTFAGAAWSQSPNTNSRSEIVPGYLNPRTNSFEPLIVQGTATPAAAAATTGRIVTHFTITVSSAIPATTPIRCEVLAIVFEQNSSTLQITNTISDSATVIATFSGGTATCTVKIPYSWFLLTPGADQAQLSYTISASTNAINAGSLVDRNSSQTFDIISIPANGSVTTETVKAVI